MSSFRRRGRRVPPKARGPRPGPPPGEASPFADGADATAPTGRTATRAQNRAAKRAAAGTRPVRRGGVRGGSRGGPSNVGLIALVVGAIVIGAAVLALGNPFGAPAASPSATASAQGSATPAASHGDGTCPTSQPASLAPGDVRTVTIETELGNIVMKIDGALAPIATGNFVALVGCHFYDGIVFHRLVPGFVIQGGDPAGNGSGGPGYAIKDDPVTASYHRGTVAMARTPSPDSQGSQFFIVLADNANQALSSAQYPYAILGEVTSGMDVVDQIAAMPNSGEPNNAALDPIPMTRVTVAPATTASPTPGASGTAAPLASPTTPAQ